MLLVVRPLEREYVQLVLLRIEQPRRPDSERQQPASFAPRENIVANRAQVLARDGAYQFLFAPGAPLVVAQRVEQGALVVAVFGLVVGDVIPGDDQAAV